MITKLISDLRAKQALYSQHGPPCSLLKAVTTDGTLANVLFRSQEALSEAGLSPLALIPHHLNKLLTGCVIGVRARFGPGFVLLHPIGVVINSSVRGGSHIYLESSVVIGDNRGKSPVLANDIFVGSGAKIIGGLSIGDGVRIGANAVVLKDVLSGSTAVGVPARVVA